jgi:catechol 2,3-dioxygenase-like lactoylglutathione lyase family enzyme
MNVTATDFVVVPTQDFERSVAFYGDTLGLQKSKQWGNMPGQEFETGNLTLAVMQSDAFGIPFSNASPIALRVDDVATARAELEAAGIAFQPDTIDSGVCHMAYFADPDGNPLILHHRYAPSA